MGCFKPKSFKIYVYVCVYIYTHTYTYMRASLIVQLIEDLSAMQEPWLDS